MALKAPKPVQRRGLCITAQVCISVTTCMLGQGVGGRG
jgi:hypothetical protein